MAEQFILGEDLGMGANKLWGPAGGVATESYVAVDTRRAVSNELLGFRNVKPPLRVRTGGTAFYVGLGAHDWGRPVENLDYDRLNGVPETRALVYASLTRYIEQHGVPENPVHMIVGLPLETLTGDEAQANADAARRWLRGNHSWEANDEAYQMTIADARITSQPSGALFDYFLNDLGQFIPERKADFQRETGIISVGFNTVEMMVLRDKAPVQGMTGGQTSGVRRLLELMNRDGHYSLGELDTQLRSGTLDVKAALPVWAREVTGVIEKTWSTRWRRFARIIIVGGGAMLLKETLMAHFNGRVYVPDVPVMATARGLYKMGQMQATRSRR